MDEMQWVRALSDEHGAFLPPCSHLWHRGCPLHLLLKLLMLIYPIVSFINSLHFATLYTKYRMNPPVHSLETQEGFFFQRPYKGGRLCFHVDLMKMEWELAHPSLRQWFSARKGWSAHSSLGIVSAPKWRSSSIFGSPSKVRASRAGGWKTDWHSVCVDMDAKRADLRSYPPPHPHLWLWDVSNDQKIRTVDTSSGKSSFLLEGVVFYSP